MRMKEMDKLWSVSNDNKFVVVDDNPESIQQFHANMGDVIRHYMDHLNMPMWKRWAMGTEWDQVEQRLRNALNHKDIQWVERH